MGLLQPSSSWGENGKNSKFRLKAFFQFAYVKWLCQAGSQISKSEGQRKGQGYR